MRLEYYVYYSHQKIMQLFRQLPESRCVAVKVSSSGNDHTDVDFHAGERHEGRGLRVARVCRNVSDGHYRESCFDPNDMYQLRRVLDALRREGRLCALEPCLCPCPGDYVEFCGLFAPEEGNSPAEDSLWIAAPAQGGCPAIRLRCCVHTFLGEMESRALREVWCCGAPLPLRGAMLALRCEQDTLCGLPLFLSL
jgi:hypothetical protein